MSILKTVRILKGFHQATLAKRVGRTQSWLSLVENEKLEPQREEAEKLAEVLGVDVETLFYS